MEYRPLKLTLISANDIKDVKRFSKMDVYADVFLVGVPQSRKRTFVHKNSGTKPNWNFPIDFIIDEPYLTRPGLSIQINLMAEGTLTPDKLIGSATVPVNDLYTSFASSPDKVLEYPVITASGKPKGFVKLSCRFGEKFTQSAEVNKRRGDEPVTAYPAQPAGYPSHHHAAPYGGYPPQQGYGYGYQAPPPGYGYGGYGQAQKPQRNGMGGMGGMGLGLGAGLLGGLLVGEMASGIGDAAAYADGYGDAMGDMGDFDF